MNFLFKRIKNYINLSNKWSISGQINGLYKMTKSFNFQMQNQQLSLFINDISNLLYQ